MLSTQLSRASAAVLALGGITFLFAADDLLPRLVPGMSPGAAWLGQLLAAAWLGLAALNWLSRAQLLGGIYGRPIVLANLAHYFIAALTLLKLVVRSNASSALWMLAAPSAVFAAAYGWLLLRGPLERDMAQQQGASGQRPAA